MFTKTRYKWHSWTRRNLKVRCSCDTLHTSYLTILPFMMCTLQVVNVPDEWKLEKWLMKLNVVRTKSEENPGSSMEHPDVTQWISILRAMVNTTTRTTTPYNLREVKPINYRV
jgi:hypothetical protein